MHYKRLLPLLYLLSVPVCMAQQDTTLKVENENYPSASLLEFLAEFGAVEDTTLELIEFHALQDSSKKHRKSSHETQ